MGKNAKRYKVAGIIVCVTLVLIFAYIAGYRITKNLRFGKIGKVEITIPLSETSIFIDNKSRVITTKENEAVAITLSPTTHSIIISHTSYFPWTKNIEMKSGDAMRLSPLFVSENPTGLIITTSDSEYWKLKHEIELKILPTEKNPLFSSDKKTKLWIADNTIIVTNGVATTTVVRPETVVRNVSFYKDRSDAVIFSTGTGIYVIETDTENVQNFMPIYTGQKPIFMENDEHSIYVEDGSTLMQVAI